VSSLPESAPVAPGAGDHAATETLFARYREAVHGFLLVRCRDADLADELTQETFVRIAASGTQPDPRRNVTAYVRTAAHNVWRDWLRRELVRRRAAAALSAQAASTLPPADAELLARELQAGLADAITRLPAEQRQVVHLRHAEQLTFQQIADRLGRPLGTVLAQMRAALRRMRDTMETYR
jgi:RNA polymerase sigma-70 factor (ECF subfamily)